MKELVLSPLPIRATEFLYASSLERDIKEAIEDKALNGSVLHTVLLSDGDFQVEITWNTFLAAFEEEMKDLEDEAEDANESNYLKDFLNSFPQTYKTNKDLPFLINFYY